MTTVFWILCHSVRERQVCRYNAALWEGLQATASPEKKENLHNMSNKEIIEVYRRYVKSLREKNANLIRNFQAMNRVLSEHCSDQELKADLYIDLLYVTLKSIKSRGIILRDHAEEDWNSFAVKECYSKIKKMNERWSAEEYEAFNILFTRFCKWVFGFEELPCLHLYFWQVYSNTEMGYWLTSKEKNETHKAVQELLANEKAGGS